MGRHVVGETDNKRKGTGITSVQSALFDPSNGQCVAGSCPGRSLERVSVCVEDNSVVVHFGETPQSVGD